MSWRCTVCSRLLCGCVATSSATAPVAVVDERQLVLFETSRAPANATRLVGAVRRVEPSSLEPLRVASSSSARGGR